MGMRGFWRRGWGRVAMEVGLGEREEGLLLFSMFSWIGDAAEHGKVSRGSTGR